MNDYVNATNMQLHVHTINYENWMVFMTIINNLFTMTKCDRFS